jgi:hypothetical protein
VNPLERTTRPDLEPPEPEAAPSDVPPPRRLPDPALPPRRRGSWEEAALTNVDITELVKRQIRTVTRPWQK